MYMINNLSECTWIQRRGPWRVVLLGNVRERVEEGEEKESHQEKAH
jgi:hypothetical protein